MTELTFGKFISVFLTSIVFVGKGGVPLAISLKLNFWQALISVCSGGIFSSFSFAFIFDGLIRQYDKFLTKHFPNRKKKKKVFTRWNRFIINAKRNFGIIGIAALSTLVLSIPLGTFLAIRFFGGRLKIFLWFSIFCVFWTTVLFSIFSGIFR